MGPARLMCAIALIGPAWAATVPVADVQQIVKNSSDRTSADWNQAPQYSFLERDVESKRDSVPVIKTYEVLMLDGSPYNRLISVGDEPLPPGEKAQERRKLENEIHKRQRESDEQRARRIEKYLKERHQDHALLKGLVDAFSFQLTGSDTVDGHDCWVLDANPKPGYQPTSHETKVLTGMRGRLWVDKASGQWAKVQAEVFHPVTMFGFFAKVRPGTRFLLEQQPVAGQLWLPKHFSMNVSASVLGLFNEDSVDDETYSHYQPMSQALSQLDTH